ncbi:hypothetical protein [Burkholderia pseudomallei]|nr:hypothetical protein [Burkholderia pseudomallei]
MHGIVRTRGRSRAAFMAAMRRGSICVTTRARAFFTQVLDLFTDCPL